MVACKCNNEDQVFIYDLLNNKVMFKIPVLANPDLKKYRRCFKFFQMEDVNKLRLFVPE